MRDNLNISFFKRSLVCYIFYSISKAYNLMVELFLDEESVEVQVFLGLIYN